MNRTDRTHRVRRPRASRFCESYFALPVLTAGIAVAGALAHVPPPHTQESVANRPELHAGLSVESVCITVSDLEKSIAFFQDVLSFTLDSRSEYAGPRTESLTGVFGSRILSARMTLGTEHIELRQFLAPEGRPIPVDSRSNDRWFQHIAIVVSDMDRAYELLREHHVRHASSGPQTLPPSIPAAAGIRAFYFKDPDGHVLEIIQFPWDKGDPRWREAGDRVFLGIDHTAIVVADTAKSIEFYHDVLGMHVAGESQNAGDEQEHLNNIFGARLRITSLRASGGPGVELLEYLSPADGRPYPPDSRSNDLWSWETNFVGASIDGLAQSLTARGAAWVSPGVVATVGEPDGLTFRDVDGHLVGVLENASAD